MKHFPLTIFLALVLLPQPSPTYAREENPIFEGEQGGSLDEQANPYVEGEKWAEGETKIPPYPKDDDLMDLHLDSTGNRFTYYIDEKSLSVSRKDYVVRYTMVVESKRGTRNIFYEGIRCKTMEYKTYAFGSGKGKLRVRKKPEWKGIGGSGHTKFRMDLMEYYFCEWKLPRQLEVIINRIKHSTPSGELDW